MTSVGLGWSPAALAAPHASDAVVRLYQAMSWLFTPVYQSDSRWLPAARLLAGMGKVYDSAMTSPCV